MTEERAFQIATAVYDAADPEFQDRWFNTHAPFKSAEQKPPSGKTMNGAKTHCPSGHAYKGDNVKIYAGRRFCMECSRARHRKKVAA